MGQKVNIGKVAITPKGAYSSSTTYDILDGVKYGNSYWISKKASNTNHTPSNGSSWWELALDGSTWDGSGVLSRIDALEAAEARKHVNYIVIDQSISDAATRISGDIKGSVIKWIRDNSHRYLGKYTASGEMTLCQLSDTNGATFAEDGSAAALDGTQGDVFMQHPTFFTHAEEILDKVWLIGFADYKVSDEWKEWSENDLIGVYEAKAVDETNNNSGGLRSISGVASTGSVSQTNFKAKARNRGTGFTIVKWQHQNIMAFLYYAYYGHANCQAQIGSGTNTYEKETGQTDALGMVDTVASTNGNRQSINFWGLENWWGNKYEWVDNVVINGNVWTITEDDGSNRNVTGQSTYNTWVYPKEWVIGANLDVIPLPTQDGGSDSQGYCDGIYMTGGNSRVVLRSCYYSYSHGGVGCASCDFDSSYAHADFGSRLAFKGTIVKAASVSAFKAATAIG